MNEPLRIVLAVLAAYAVGSIPFGWVVARVFKGIDIRTVGSGNIGATNVARSIGKGWGLFVLLLDALKGLIPAYVFPLVALTATSSELTQLRVFCGVAAIVGHMFPCWLRFRGGKGVATALGVVAVLAPLATAIAAGVFLMTIGLTRIVSLGSMLAAVSFAVAAMWQLWPTPFSSETWSLATFSILIPLLIIIRHRTNLGRLLRGEEPRFGERAATKTPPEDAIAAENDGERAESGT